MKITDTGLLQRMVMSMLPGQVLDVSNSDFIEIVRRNLTDSTPWTVPGQDDINDFINKISKNWEIEIIPDHIKSKYRIIKATHD